MLFLTFWVFLTRPDLRFQTPARLGNALARVRDAVSSEAPLSVQELRSDYHRTIEQSPKGKPKRHTVRWLTVRSGLGRIIAHLKRRPERLAVAEPAAFERATPGPAG